MILLKIKNKKNNLNKIFFKIKLLKKKKKKNEKILNFKF